jgi:hypothetical protein
VVFFLLLLRHTICMNSLCLFYLDYSQSEVLYRSESMSIFFPFVLILLSLIEYQYHKWLNFPPRSARHGSVIVGYFQMQIIPPPFRIYITHSSHQIYCYRPFVDKVTYTTSEIEVIENIYRKILLN